MSNRVVGQYNALPEYVKHAANIDVLKALLDKQTMERKYGRQSTR